MCLYFSGTCTSSDTEIIHVDSEPDASITHQTDLCETDASVILSAADTGGTWSGTGITNASTGEFDPSVSGSGDHTITYTITNGACSDSDTDVIHVDSISDASILSTGPYCDNESSVYLNAANGGGIWSGSGITDSITGEFNPSSLTSGTYTISYTVTNGECTDTDNQSITIQSPSDPQITSSTDFCVNDPQTTLTSVSSGGVWSGNGIVDSISGTFDPSIVVSDSVQIIYTTITGSCSASDSIWISVHELPDVYSTNINDPLCYGDSNGSITVGSSDPNANFTWSDMSSGSVYDNLSAGPYSVTVQNAHGCEDTAIFTLTEPPQLTASITNSTDITCNGDDNGSISATASGGTVSGSYTWSWSNGMSTSNIQNLSPGTYTLTVSDDNSCSLVLSETISEPSAINIVTNTTDVMCGISMGSCSVNASGGSGGFTYQWSGLSDTSSTVGNLMAGSYSITVTDSSGCSESTSFTINSNGNISVNINPVSDITCNGYSDGALEVTSNGSGTLNYNWSPGTLTGSTASNLGSGIYQVTVSDTYGCSGSASYTLIEPDALTVISFTDSVSCYGSSDGSISLNISGGTPSYSVVWGIGETGTTISNLGGGLYHYTVTDSHSCTISDSIELYSPSSDLLIDITKKDISCYGETDGMIDASGIGGTTPYSYSWSENGNQLSTGSIIEELSSGFYSLQMTDSRGCSADTIVEISEPSPLIADYVFSHPSCIGIDNGYIHLQVSGGTSPYYYLIGDMTYPVSDIEGLEEGYYEIKVVDNNGCEYQLKGIQLIDNPVECIKIPNAFTPNEDGVNESWIIENIDIYDKYLITVYNRWGQKLHEQKPGDEPWDGKSPSGKLVPAGNYVYVIDLRTNEDPYSGIVTVIY